jgi:hypothetical protein
MVLVSKISCEADHAPNGGQQGSKLIAKSKPPKRFGEATQINV